MKTSLTHDFMEILERPSMAYEEGLRFFKGTGLMNDTLRQLARDLDRHEIPYTVIGAVALNQHGYQRFTTDIDILMTREGLQRFSSELIGPGYTLVFEGATKKFRATAENVPIEVMLSGEYPGDGKPKDVVFPEPEEFSVIVDGIKTITLPKLMELKLASGITGAGRRKDLADVQELIKVRKLDSLFAEQLDPMVRPMYLELHSEVSDIDKMTLAPDWEPEDR